VYTHRTTYIHIHAAHKHRCMHAYKHIHMHIYMYTQTHTDAYSHKTYKDHLYININTGVITMVREKYK